MKLSKLFLPLIVISVVLIIYFLYFAPSAELGLFSKFSSGSEINQRINVEIVKNKKIERDNAGGIISFYARDKKNVVVRVSFHEPVSDEILDAKIVELLGHMHDNNFSASKVTIIK